MRAVFVIAFLALASAATVRKERALEQTIIDFLECLRGEMLVGWPDHGVPHLNPLEVADLTVDITSLGIEGIRGNINVQDLVFGGATDFEYENIKGTIGLIPPSYTVELDLNIPNPTLSTKYSGEVAIDALALDTFGTGELSFDANNFRANIGLKAGILGGITLDYLDVWVSMDPLTAFKITGVRNDEDFSQQVTDEILNNGVEMMAELAGTIHDLAEQVAMDALNGGVGEEGGFLSGIVDRCLAL